MAKNSIQPMILLSMNSAGFDGTYQQLTDSVGSPLSILKIVNNSNQNITISYNGVTDHDFVAANTQVIYEFQTNSVPNNKVSLLASETPIWILGTAAGAGMVYVSGWYSSQGV